MSEFQQKEEMSCFVIMPFTDPLGYSDGHFREVYECIIEPAISSLNLRPIRLDNINSTNNIHVSLLQHLYISPIAVCDISSLNPNVLFELGFRQALNRPTVIIKDGDTKNIFDLASMSYIEYQKDLNFRSVEKFRKQLVERIENTIKNPIDSSLIALLSVSEKSRLSSGEITINDIAKSISVITDAVGEIKSRIDVPNIAELLNKTGGVFMEMLGNNELAKSIIGTFGDAMSTEGAVESKGVDVSGVNPVK
jgi:hypothetical protein